MGTKHMKIACKLFLSYFLFKKKNFQFYSIYSTQKSLHTKMHTQFPEVFLIGGASV